MDEKLLKELEELAAKNIASDEEDFSIFDYSGGNFDDTYWMGVDAGEVLLARRIINNLKG